MVTNQNERTFTYDHSNQLAYGNLRGLENFSCISSYEKNSQLVSDYARYSSFEEEHRLKSLKNENDKRPCADVSPNQVGYKRPKQVSDSDSFQRSAPTDEVACNDPQDSSWFKLDSPIWAPQFPNYFDCPSVKSGRVKPTCSPFREFSPIQESYDDRFHKSIAIGPNHQAEIPSCKSKHADCDKWVEDCVISTPDSEPVVNRRIECDCLDECSIECVRKHVSEARENLRRELGEERFEKLGFCDMGEEVALKWREEEERLFEQVVLSNPKSADMNFWEELPTAFPSKSRGELVSYYFNVFMLRKRAAQNRFDPTNIDSDDDEWQEIQNDSQIEEEEEEEEEEEDGSGIECTSDDSVSNDDSTKDTSETSLAKDHKKEELSFGFGTETNDSCTSFDESVNCENITDGFGVMLDDGFFHDDFNTSDKYYMDKVKDDFSEMGNAFEEFIRTENWERK